MPVKTILVLSILTLTSVFSTADLSAQTRKKVGAILVLSSDWGEWGLNCQRAISLALKKERNIDLIIESSESAKPKNALLAMNKLVSLDKVDLILGPMSPEGYAAIAPLAEKKNIPIISFVSSTYKSPGSILIWVDPEYEMEVLAQYARKSSSKIAILSSDMEWETRGAQAFAKEFKRLGGIVSVVEEPSTSSQDVSSEVLRVKKSGADSVFISSYLLYSHYQKELSQQGFRGVRFGVELDASAISLAGASGEGTIFISPLSGESNFKDDFKSVYNSEPNMPAAQCYDAAMIGAQFLNQKESNYSSFLTLAKELKRYIGVSGTIEFKDGHVMTDTALWKVEDGTPKLLETFKIK